MRRPTFGGVIVDGIECCWRRKNGIVEVILPGCRVYTILELIMRGHLLGNVPE